ncbi:kinetochore-associated Ndc80 complex subunit spc25 [Ophidiomyces ophidiicola]|uniref:Kinetochore-associated Ndc80 complex subunit spc25 n=1 Tax=Ophidiomyces ophidiicola TaxID=1387563 RepID=A0ACB8UN11_9EURO|nr:kinetochore-associated Ndc80 complex subunit spc25 [Ophidiomyces ophidiicola]KAI1905739.1 kinetochore-associated Ndc80 complex subunit spc25 [Ophidiomyces ophidiicola]KAI1932354.1 kinetochore-associated Ndc80 complex subunit spc25 [Ophidiomyces ophidiicola]KAI1953674.1 kinetochore-associated Ndc80 complex subunit spc25 [Ophidiomyces ophidiicola]KAI1979372.1 kinetochore-associated Ndc80 complex subunit spc25 [Ophidiomyces ophidiicola]KAI1980768.1 kinetochore-associated Ndc80 complex subunit 
MASATFDPTMSLSGMRPPLASADAPSMADQLPALNFGFEDLRARMAQFTTKFDAFIERGRKQVLEERNQFRVNLAELQEDRRMKQKDIEILALKTQTHAQTLQKETMEAAEMNEAIAMISQQCDTQLVTRDRLKQQIEETQKTINQRLEAQKAHARHLESQARLNVPELEFWQDYLCLRIEGAGREDRLKVVYSHLLEKDWEKEAWFELGTSSREYEVFRCRPKLERGAIERELDIINEDRDFGAFLKRMRKLFVAAMK